DHLAELGVDAVWLSPFYRSPQRDAGYDVADYRDVDPRFGSLEDADAMLARAHELGLRVIVDLVPNHTSEDHEWFRAALAAGPGSPERERYIFREGRGPGVPSHRTSGPRSSVAAPGPGCGTGLTPPAPPGPRTASGICTSSTPASPT